MRTSVFIDTKFLSIRDNDRKKSELLFDSVNPDIGKISSMSLVYLKIANYLLHYQTLVLKTDFFDDKRLLLKAGENDITRSVYAVVQPQKESMEASLQTVKIQNAKGFFISTHDYLLKRYVLHTPKLTHEKVFVDIENSNLKIYNINNNSVIHNINSIAAGVQYDFYFDGKFQIDGIPLDYVSTQKTLFSKRAKGSIEFGKIQQEMSLTVNKVDMYQYRQILYDELVKEVVQRKKANGMFNNHFPLKLENPGDFKRVSPDMIKYYTKGKKMYIFSETGYLQEGSYYVIDKNDHQYRSEMIKSNVINDLYGKNFIKYDLTSKPKYLHVTRNEDLDPFVIRILNNPSRDTEPLQDVIEYKDLNFGTKEIQSANESFYAPAGEVPFYFVDTTLTQTDSTGDEYDFRIKVDEFVGSRFFAPINFTQINSAPFSNAESYALRIRKKIVFGQFEDQEDEHALRNILINNDAVLVEGTHLIWNNGNENLNEYIGGQIKKTDDQTQIFETFTASIDGKTFKNCFITSQTQHNPMGPLGSIFYNRHFMCLNCDVNEAKGKKIYFKGDLSNVQFSITLQPSHHTPLSGKAYYVEKIFSNEPIELPNQQLHLKNSYGEYIIHDVTGYDLNDIRYQPNKYFSIKHIYELTHDDLDALHLVGNKIIHDNIARNEVIEENDNERLYITSLVKYISATDTDNLDVLNVDEKWQRRYYILTPGIPIQPYYETLDSIPHPVIQITEIQKVKRATKYKIINNYAKNNVLPPPRTRIEVLPNIFYDFTFYPNIGENLKSLDAQTPPPTPAAGPGLTYNELTTNIELLWMVQHIEQIFFQNKVFEINLDILESHKEMNYAPDDTILIYEEQKRDYEYEYISDEHDSIHIIPDKIVKSQYFKYPEVSFPTLGIDTGSKISEAITTHFLPKLVRKKMSELEVEMSTRITVGNFTSDHQNSIAKFDVFGEFENYLDSPLFSFDHINREIFSVYIPPGKFNENFDFTVTFVDIQKDISLEQKFTFDSDYKYTMNLNLRYDNVVRTKRLDVVANRPVNSFTLLPTYLGGTESQSVRIPSGTVVEIEKTLEDTNLHSDDYDVTFIFDNVEFTTLRLQDLYYNRPSSKASQRINANLKLGFTNAQGEPYPILTDDDVMFAFEFESDS